MRLTRMTVPGSSSPLRSGRAVQVSPLASFTWPAVRCDRGQHLTGEADEGGDVGRSRVLAASQAPQQRRTQDQDEHGGHDRGDDDLQPDGRAEQVGHETRDAADAEHQEREIEREHLDHQEDRIRTTHPIQAHCSMVWMSSTACLPVVRIYHAGSPGSPAGTCLRASVGRVDRRPRDRARRPRHPADQRPAPPLESSVTESLTPLDPGSLSGKTALVTGSSRGIGADTVRYFAQAGANVVINYRNKAPRAEKLAAELRGLGVEALVVGADLTDPESVQAMFAEVERTFGALDILVLNASGRHGVGHGRGLRAAAQPRRAAARAGERAAAARRGFAGGVRHEPPGALHPHHPDDAGVRAGRAVQARRRGRPPRADPGARRSAASDSSSSRAT